MRIASFDPGAKNLAVTVLEIMGLAKHKRINFKLRTDLVSKKFPQEAEEIRRLINQKFFRIDYWENINLGIDPQFHGIKCATCNNSRDAKFQYQGIGLCGVHYNAKHYPQYAPIICKTPKQMPQLEISRRLMKTLDTIPGLEQIDYVLIENQPSKAHSKIKALQYGIQDYFLIKHPEVKKIVFMSAKHKLKSYFLPEEKALVSRFFAESKETNQYAKNKEVSVKMARHILRNFPELLQKLDKSKKEDDLCDSFLQAYTYFNSIMHF